MVLAAALALAGCSKMSANGSPTPVHPAVNVTLETAPLSQVHQSVVVDGVGYALYLFVPDHRDGVTCKGTCAKVWPPVEVAKRSDLHLGAGIQPNLVGTVAGPGGSRVVTYNGWPLYRYASDNGPGLAAGQGLNLNGGYWYVIRPDGKAIVPAGAPQPAGPSVREPTSPSTTSQVPSGRPKPNGPGA